MLIPFFRLLPWLRKVRECVSAKPSGLAEKTLYLGRLDATESHGVEHECGHENRAKHHWGAEGHHQIGIEWDHGEAPFSACAAVRKERDERVSAKPDGLAEQPRCSANIAVGGLHLASPSADHLGRYHSAWAVNELYPVARRDEREMLPGFDRISPHASISPCF
ncbi:MAG: hypothetical protein ACYCSN_18530 [Acidobacteriaceae bacterium]